MASYAWKSSSGGLLQAVEALPGGPCPAQQGRVCCCPCKPCCIYRVVSVGTTCKGDARWVTAHMTVEGRQQSRRRVAPAQLIDPRARPLSQLASLLSPSTYPLPHQESRLDGQTRRPLKRWLACPATPATAAGVVQGRRRGLWRGCMRATWATSVCLIEQYVCLVGFLPLPLPLPPTPPPFHQSGACRPSLGASPPTTCPRAPLAPPLLLLTGPMPPASLQGAALSIDQVFRNDCFFTPRAS